MTRDLYNSFFKLVEQSVFKSVLCLNGELPHASFFYQLNKYSTFDKMPIIAVDGAANQLLKDEIVPEVVIGDLDSIDKIQVKKLNLVHIVDQELCDFGKSLNYIRKNSMAPSIILGMGGGCIDHILNNVILFTMTTGDVFFAPPIAGFLVRSKRCKTISLPINTKISLMGAPRGSVTTKGLKWDLQEKELCFFGYRSCFNRTTNDYITITVNSGVVLALIYLLDVHDCGKFI
ncbi:thiamine diphosphokinase [Candidatus Lariskella endosymbiont of Hedychridium roseum]|uniref:thiamine diphosphokinase n=1 Tax=Candidatus Lariskella endosymbiont of Hedychridium roseum TaxID=3077949 RepID=UPI0030D4F3B7